MDERGTALNVLMAVVAVAAGCCRAGRHCLGALHHQHTPAVCVVPLYASLISCDHTAYCSRKSLRMNMFFKGNKSAPLALPLVTVGGVGGGRLPRPHRCCPALSLLCAPLRIDASSVWVAMFLTCDFLFERLVATAAASCALLLLARRCHVSTGSWAGAS